MHQDDSGCARISAEAILPMSSTKFEISWIDAADDIGDNDQSEEGERDSDQSATVVGDFMHVLRERIVQTQSVLRYESSNSIGVVEFDIVAPRKGTRITSVSGFALSRWTAGQYDTTESTTPVKVFVKSSNLDSSVRRMRECSDGD